MPQSIGFSPRLSLVGVLWGYFCGLRVLVFPGKPEIWAFLGFYKKNILKVIIAHKFEHIYQV